MINIAFPVRNKKQIVFFPHIKYGGDWILTVLLYKV